MAVVEGISLGKAIAGSGVGQFFAGVFGGGPGGGPRNEAERETARWLREYVALTDPILRERAREQIGRPLGQQIPQPIPEPSPGFGGIALPPIAFPAPRRRPRRPPKPPRRRRPPRPPRPPPRRPRRGVPELPKAVRILRRAFPAEILRVLGTIPKRFGGPRGPGGRPPIPPEPPPASPPGTPPDWRRIFEQEEERREREPVPEVIVTARVKRPRLATPPLRPEPRPEPVPAIFGTPGALPSPEWCSPVPGGGCVYRDAEGYEIRDADLEIEAESNVDFPDLGTLSDEEKWEIWRGLRAEQDADLEDEEYYAEIDAGELEPDYGPAPAPAPAPAPFPGPAPAPAPAPGPGPRPIFLPPVTVDLGDLAELWLRRDKRGAPTPRLAPEQAAVSGLQPLTAIEARRAECEPGRQKRQKRKRTPRKVCYRGTYKETATRRSLIRRARISCITGKPLK